MEFYRCCGSSGTTFGVETEKGTYIQIEHPSGDLSEPSLLEQYDNWNLQRWISQYGAEKVDRKKVPEALVMYAEEG